jgi:glycosyltransferase involved in cell wall biosynthesis
MNKIVKILNFKKNPFPYLKKADLFLLTSKFEGLPNVLLEAATLKKNIISTDCPTGPREILNNGKYGFYVK